MLFVIVGILLVAIFLLPVLGNARGDQDTVVMTQEDKKEQYEWTLAHDNRIEIIE